MFACCRRSALAFVAYFSLVSLAFAQPVPPPKEFYFDPDPMAVPMQAIEGGPADLVDQLMRQRNRGRRVVETSVQLAGIALREGRQELALSLYDDAAAQATATQQRGVRWNQGWEFYRQGDAEGGLKAWVQALQSTRLQPSWAPPTLALALWKLGRRDEAVAWYAAAVRTEPQDWSDPANHARLLPDWSHAERALLLEVFSAWAADPPSWP